MAKVIDARGRSCPEPVMMTKNAIDNNETDLEVLVDTKVAVENITRFVKNKGFNISVEENNGEYKLIINRWLNGWLLLRSNFSYYPACINFWKGSKKQGHWCKINACSKAGKLKLRYSSKGTLRTRERNKKLVWWKKPSNWGVLQDIK